MVVFGLMDLDGDGVVTANEATDFLRLDADGDGVVTAHECGLMFFLVAPRRAAPCHFAQARD